MGFPKLYCKLNNLTRLSDDGVTDIVHYVVNNYGHSYGRWMMQDIIHFLLGITVGSVSQRTVSRGPGRFPGIAGNAGIHGNDGKFHESHKILNQISTNINELCLGKISRQKAVRIKFSVDSVFSNMFYGKKTKTRKYRKSTQSFLNSKGNLLSLLENC